MRELLIRPFVPADTPAICRLYVETTRTINGRDYTPAQVERWVAFAAQQEQWRERLGRNRTLVADHHGQIVGFAELEQAGEVGYFYVAALHQSQGIGRQLMAGLLRAAREQKCPALHADVSLSAQPFFSAQGFSVLETSQPIVCGAPALRYRMVYHLPPG